jgi:hypothetical protein
MQFCSCCCLSQLDGVFADAYAMLLFFVYVVAVVVVVEKLPY